MHCAQTQAFELTHCVLAQVLGIDSALLEKTTYIVELRAPQWPHIPIFPGKNEKMGKYEDKFYEKAVFQSKEPIKSEKCKFRAAQLEISVNGAEVC